LAQKKILHLLEFRFLFSAIYEQGLQLPHFVHLRQQQRLASLVYQDGWHFGPLLQKYRHHFIYLEIYSKLCFLVPRFHLPFSSIQRMSCCILSSFSFLLHLSQFDLLQLLQQHLELPFLHSSSKSPKDRMQFTKSTTSRTAYFPKLAAIHRKEVHSYCFQPPSSWNRIRIFDFIRVEPRSYIYHCSIIPECAST